MKPSILTLVERSVDAIAEGNDQVDIRVLKQSHNRGSILYVDVNGATILRIGSLKTEVVVFQEDQEAKYQIVNVRARSTQKLIGQLLFAGPYTEQKVLKQARDHIADGQECELSEVEDMYVLEATVPASLYTMSPRRS